MPQLAPPRSWRLDAKRLGHVAALWICCTLSSVGTAQSVEDSLYEGILDNRVGQFVTVRDFGLPDEYVRRYANRLIKEGARERAYLVRGLSPADPAPKSNRRPGNTPYRMLGLFRAPPNMPAESCPDRRGFRFDYLGKVELLPPATENVVEVGRSLARDGLLATAATQLAKRAAASPGAMDAAQCIAALHNDGIPVDLLGCFDRDGSSQRLVARVAARLREGVELDALKLELARLPFRFAPTDPSFRPTYSDGGDTIAQLRVQLPRGDSWGGDADGGGVDILQQVLRSVPHIPVLAEMYAAHVDALDRRLRRTAHEAELKRLTILPLAFQVDQWAQDNGKAGSITRSDKRVAATLAPRFASRREDISQFVPGSNAAIAALAARGQTVLPSRLLFQGGNLLFAREPVSGRDVLFVGEAEVWRNVALGLTRDQAVEALRVEFGADTCVVLPSISFHIDYDVSLRRVGGKLLALVADEVAAARAVIESSLDTLATVGLAESARQIALESLRRNHDAATLEAIGPFIASCRNSTGKFELETVRHFGTHPIHAAAAFFRLLVAFEILESRAIPTEQLDSSPAYALARAHDRERTLQANLQRQLESAGCEVIAVPSLSEDAMSLGTLNGVHAPGYYLMPSFGGALAAFDLRAASAIESALGESVRVVPIRCWSSQLSLGALHCSIAAYPEPFVVR